ncbi:DOMON domain-containing protein, partial [Longispora fulva]
MPFKKSFLALFLLISLCSYSQEEALPEKRSYTATRITETPEIDGILDEDIWRTIPETSNFVMLEPGDGEAAPASHQTKVKIGYTNEAIYIGAYMFDDDPSTIRRQFAQRDNIPVADAFIVDINT